MSSLFEKHCPTWWVSISVRVLGSDFDINNMKAWIQTHPVLYQWFRMLTMWVYLHCIVWNLNWAFSHHSLLKYRCWPSPSLRVHREPIFWWLHTATWQWVHYTLQIHQISKLLIEQLWDVVEQEISIKTNHLWGRFPPPCWIYATKNKGSSGNPAQHKQV